MTHRVAPSSIEPRAAGLDGLRVLAVEDHAIGRVLLEAMLTGLGVSAQLVGTGEDALDLVRDESFDVILIDLGLPDMPGEELARTLARHLAGREPPFVAVTGRARPAVLPAIFADWLEKPFSVRELHRMLRSLGERIARTG